MGGKGHRTTSLLISHFAIILLAEVVLRELEQLIFLLYVFFFGGCIVVKMEMQVIIFMKTFILFLLVCLESA